MASLPWPVTWNKAVVGVPEITLAPPEGVRTEEAFIAIVPAVALAATVPKFISVVFVIESGVTRVAVVLAVIVDWANEVAENPRITIAMAKSLLMFFMVWFSCLWVSLVLVTYWIWKE